MKNLVIVSVAGLALAATANAQVFDLSGFQYDTGGPPNGQPGGMGPAITFGSVVSGGVTTIAWDLSLTTMNGSWGSEVNIDITGPGGLVLSLDGNDAPGAGGIEDGPDDVTFGWGNSAGTFTAAGSIAVANQGAGTYTLTIFEEFNDAGDDARFNAGSTITLIPAPGAAAVLGLGGLAAVRRRR